MPGESKDSPTKNRNFPDTFSKAVPRGHLYQNILKSEEKLTKTEFFQSTEGSKQAENGMDVDVYLGTLKECISSLVCCISCMDLCISKIDHCITHIDKCSRESVVPKFNTQSKKQRLLLKGTAGAKVNINDSLSKKAKSYGSITNETPKAKPNGNRAFSTLDTRYAGSTLYSLDEEVSAEILTTSQNETSPATQEKTGVSRLETIGIEQVSKDESSHYATVIPCQPVGIRIPPNSSMKQTICFCKHRNKTKPHKKTLINGIKHFESNLEEGQLKEIPSKFHKGIIMSRWNGSKEKVKLNGSKSNVNRNDVEAVVEKTMSENRLKLFQLLNKPMNIDVTPVDSLILIKGSYRTPSHERSAHFKSPFIQTTKSISEYVDVHTKRDIVSNPKFLQGKEETHFNANKPYNVSIKKEKKERVKEKSEIEEEDEEIEEGLEKGFFKPHFEGMEVPESDYELSSSFPSDRDSSMESFTSKDTDNPVMYKKVIESGTTQQSESVEKTTMYKRKLV